ncbi:hypothetical protein HID58_047800 [Brassica napus]|uniref:Uncharacterized protein n=1 Tax=Brassica napus TaxID=3708 RepID=A0ABQ8B0C1_BRANA|nr:hypothetical protein HID58_047800 [Brassica napus]
MPFLACARLPDQVGLAPSCLFKSRGDLLFCGFIPRLSRVDEDPTAFGSSRGGGLAVVWPRAFTLNSCYRFSKS